MKETARAGTVCTGSRSRRWMSFRKAGSAQFDRLSKVTKPFQILPGGYQIVFKNGTWSQIFASASKKKRFGREDRRGHRSEQRVRAARNKLRRAETST